MELFYFMSCDYGPCYRHFDKWTDQIMKVDSFFLSSDTINTSDVIAASFWGKIGGRMYCDTFGYFRESRIQFDIHITLFEKYFDVCPDTCTKTTKAYGRYALLFKSSLFKRKLHNNSSPA